MGLPRLSRKFVLVWCVSALLLLTAWMIVPAAENTAFRLVQCEPAADALSSHDDLQGYVSQILYKAESGVAHSPTIAQHKDGSLQVIWFAGRDEADPDTGLLQMRLSDGIWTKAEQLLTARKESLERDLSIHTIGNPLLFVDVNGLARLFYVTPSLGGWATSRISVRNSTDYGQNWGEARLLYTSGFFNMSTLVRQSPICLDNGDFALPIHFELAIDYPILATLNDANQVTGLTHMYAQGGEGIQPLVITGSGNNAVALIRPTKGMRREIYQSVSANGGQSWSDPEATGIANPRAPVCGIDLGDGRALMGYNDSDDGRKNFSLAYRADENAVWQRLDHVFDGSSDQSRFAYCSMIKDADERMHIVFSDRYKGEIHYASWSQEWLRERLP